MKRLATLALTILMAAFAGAQVTSTPAGEPPLDPKLADIEKAFGNVLSFLYTKDPVRLSTLTGELEQPAGPVTVNKMLAEAARSAGADPSDFAAPIETVLGTSRQYLYRQTYRDKPGATRQPIEDAFVVITVDERGYDWVINAVRRQQAFAAVRDVESAKRLAVKTLLYELGEKHSKDQPSILEKYYSTIEPPTPTVVDSMGFTKSDGEIARVRRIRVEAFANVNGCRTRLALREYDIDATTKSNDIAAAVVRRRNLLHRACSLNVRLFDPSPVNTLNVCSITSGDIAKAFVERRLELHSSVSQGTFNLTSDYVKIGQVEGPNPEPPLLSVENDSSFTFRQNSPELAALMAYYHITEFQRHVGSLGLRSLIRQIKVDVESQKPSDDAQSAYLDVPTGKGPITFGRRSLMYLAEDAELIAHEFAHALLFHKTQGRFGIMRKDDSEDPAERESEAGAIAEGFADYWALSSFLDQTHKNGHRIDCYAEWVSYHAQDPALRGQGCVRTATAKVMYKYDSAADEHANGLMWSSILFDILVRALSEDRAVADRIILVGHLLRAFTGLAPTMHRMADGIVIADLKEFGGRHKQALCAVFKLHGLNGLDCCSQEGCAATAAKEDDWTDEVEAPAKVTPCEQVSASGGTPPSP